MTLTQKILGVAALGLAFVSASVAQDTSASLLGVRYVETGFAYNDINNSSVDAFSVGANLNVPVTANLDLTAGYTYLWAEGNRSVYANGATVSATGYITEGAWRTFVVGTLGHVWQSSNLGGDDYGVWSAGIGAEYSINSQTAVAALISYDDTFQGGDNHSISGGARLSHWFTSAIAGTFGVTWLEGGSLSYSVSAIFKF